MFIAALINSNSPKLKHAKYPSKDKKVSKLWYIHKIEYFSAIKKEQTTDTNKIDNLKNIIL